MGRLRMNEQALLVAMARTLVAGGKGLLAMDESNPTCNRRFAAVGIPQTEEARRAYRELLVTTPRLGECISGAILYDETIRQQTRDGTAFVEILTDSGHRPGHQGGPGREAPGGPSRARRSPRAWTDCVPASSSMSRWAPASPSGER